MSVRAAGRSQSVSAADCVIRSDASSAGVAVRAASSLACTSAEICSGSTLLELTVPTFAMSPSRTIEITVHVRDSDTPLVVIELLAHRSDASLASVTITNDSSTVLAANARSTTCCGSITAEPPNEY